MVTEPTAVLPPRRDPSAAAYAIALVCLGNICRSAMAQVVLTRKLQQAGLASRVTVESAGTGDWHIGETMDRRAAATLKAAGYDGSGHRARLFEPEWFASHDLILVMDNTNRRDVLAMAPNDEDRERVKMLRDFDPEAVDDRVLPDPWYGGQRGFDDVLTIVERVTDTLVDLLSESPAGSGG